MRPEIGAILDTLAQGQSVEAAADALQEAGLDVASAKKAIEDFQPGPVKACGRCLRHYAMEISFCPECGTPLVEPS